MKRFTRFESALIAIVITLGFAVVVTMASRSRMSASANSGQPVDFHWAGVLEPGKTLEVRGIKGDIRVVAATGNELSLDAHRSGWDADEVKVDVVPGPDGLTVCASYMQRDGSWMECKAGGGDSHIGHVDANVDFTIRVPKGVKLKAHTVSGSIEADGLAAPSEVQSVSGRIRVNSDSSVEAETVNGSIEARMSKADWSGTLNFSSVNGTVEVALPPNASADVEADTMNGSIRSEFEMNYREMTRRHIEARIGDGGRKLKLSTVNGRLAITKNTV